MGKCEWGWLKHIGFLNQDYIVKWFQNDKNTVNESETQFDADAKIETNSPHKVFTAEEIEAFLISNALLMFIAGFDTSSSGMALVR